MEKIILGKTGLRATVAGLGCGGFSRIGIEKYGQDHAAGIVRAAFDEGVNFFDTAAAYGTESAVGQGLDGIARDKYILSTKYPYKWGGEWKANGGDKLMASLENSLRELRTDYIDIYHLHGVTQEDYADARDILLPAMHKARDQGKIGFLGITELFYSDTAHAMLNVAVPENLFDVIMVGYNILNPSAAKFILPKTAELNTGVLCMFAVRSALSNPEQLVTDLKKIISRGQAGEGLLAASKDALDFLIAGETCVAGESCAAGETGSANETGETSETGETGAAMSANAAAVAAAATAAASARRQPVASTIMEAAYRFCRHTPQIHVVLTGTGNAGHLRDNLRSINSPPLPDAVLERLEAMFGQVDCVSGQ